MVDNSTAAGAHCADRVAIMTPRANEQNIIVSLVSLDIGIN